MDRDGPGHRERLTQDTTISAVTIGILGAGAMARAIAKHLAAAGSTVILSNRRGPESLADVATALGPAVRGGTVDEAAGQPIVILAIPWSQLPSTLARLQPWNDRIVIDTTNPIEPPHYEVADLDGLTSSEVVRDLVPGARLVKAFNTLTPAAIERDPREGGGNRVIFYSGDDESAKVEVRTLLAACGFAGVDLGTLAIGGRLQQFPGGPLAALNLIRL